MVGAFTGAIRRWQCHQAKERYGLDSARDAHTGAITAVQRFGSALNLNVHCHTIVPDGVFVEDAEHLRFRRIGAPDPKEIEQIAWDTCIRTLTRLRREGRWVDEEAPGDDAEDTLAHDQPLLSALYEASIAGRIALEAVGYPGDSPAVSAA